MQVQFPNYQSLIWEGVNYNREVLRKYAHDQLRKKIPVWRQELLKFILEWTNDQETISIFSSGTTGEKKSNRVHKDHLVKSALMSKEALKLDGVKSACLALPANFIAGKMMVVRAMVLGWNLSTIEPASNPLNNYEVKVNFIALVPAQVFEILQDKLSEQKLRSINKVLVGGGALSSHLENELKELPNEVYHSFGMAETLSHFALRRINGDQPEVEYSVIKGFEINTDEDGCLVVKKTPWADELIETNDIVELTGPGKFVWLGRKDNLINRGGIKIMPEEVEKKLSPYIKEPFYLSTEPNKKWGEVIVLNIEGAETKCDWQAMWASANLRKAEIPGKVEYHSEIKRTASQKIIRE